MELTPEGYEERVMRLSRLGKGAVDDSEATLSEERGAVRRQDTTNSATSEGRG